MRLCTGWQCLSQYTAPLPPLLDIPNIIWWLLKVYFFQHVYGPLNFVNIFKKFFAVNFFEINYFKEIFYKIVVTRFKKLYLCKRKTIFLRQLLFLCQRSGMVFRGWCTVYSKRQCIDIHPNHRHSIYKGKNNMQFKKLS